MAKLPIVDDQERQVIRAQLKMYQEKHGNIGVPTLHQCMLFVLDVPDHHYVDFKSLQRFMSDQGRTTDEKVIRYRKFLERLAPEDAPKSFAVELGRLFAGNMLVPEYISLNRKEEIDGQVRFIPEKAVPFFEYYWRHSLDKYQGRYELSYDGAASESFGFNQHLLLLTTPDERYLRALRLVPIIPDGLDAAKVDPADVTYDLGSGEALFMKCGYGQFALVSAAYADMSFMLFAEVDEQADSQPLVLTGAALQTQPPGEQTPRTASVTLTRIFGPDLS